MGQWWKRNKIVMDGDNIQGGYTKKEVEDFTGCIPLFLDRCVVDGQISLKTQFFFEIYMQAMAFVLDIKSKCDRTDWDKYVALVLSLHYC